jgi:hypothetical protein
VKAAAAPCVDGLILWLQGDNLFQTLMLNLVPQEVCAADLPAWQDDDIVQSAIRSWQAPVAFAGPVQRFAPLSRFIRIVDRSSVFFTNGLKASADANDPMKPYSRGDAGEEYKPVKLREARAAWRDAHTLFSLGSSVRKAPSAFNPTARVAEYLNGSVPRANVVGMATDKDKALLWRHERVPVPVSILQSVDLGERLATLLGEAEIAGADLSQGLFWSATAKKTIRKEPVGRVQSIADLLVSPTMETREKGITRTAEGRSPEEAHNKAAMDLSNDLDPRPAYWARLERHFLDLLEYLPNDWDADKDEWKPDHQQKATRIWRDAVKREATRALQESIRTLGTTARAIQALARVRTDFNDSDLKPPPPKGAKVKGGKEE